MSWIIAESESKVMAREAKERSDETFRALINNPKAFLRIHPAGQFIVSSYIHALGMTPKDAYKKFITELGLDDQLVD